MECKVHKNILVDSACTDCGRLICPECQRVADFSGLCPFCYMQKKANIVKHSKVAMIVFSVFSVIFGIATAYLGISLIVTADKIKNSPFANAPDNYELIILAVAIPFVISVIIACITGYVRIKQQKKLGQIKYKMSKSCQQPRQRSM